MEEIYISIIAFLLLALAWVFALWQRWGKRAVAAEEKHEAYVTRTTQEHREYRDHLWQKIIALQEELDNRHPLDSLRILRLGDGSFQLEKWHRKYSGGCWGPGQNPCAWRFVQAFADKSEVAKFTKAQETEKLREEEERKNAELRETVPPAVYWP